MKSTERKFSKYSHRTISGAKAVARNDGHTQAPLFSYWDGGLWHLLYPASNPVVTLARLRTSRFRSWLAGIHRWFSIGTQHQIIKELRRA